MAQIQPIHDNVLLKPAALEEKTKSGIILPDSAKEKTKQGEVIAVGNGKYNDGKIVPMQVKVGDKVLYSWGDEIKVEGTEYILASESNIQAIIS